MQFIKRLIRGIKEQLAPNPGTAEAGKPAPALSEKEAIKLKIKEHKNKGYVGCCRCGRVSGIHRIRLRAWSFKGKKFYICGDCL